MSNGGVVLIVEDSPIIRKLIRDQVSKFGYTPREADNGVNGLAEMRREAPDCVILDLMMPVMSGPEVLVEMQQDETLKNIPVIVVTALGDMDKIVYCIEHGAADYMQKPFRPQLLRARLDSCVERKRLNDREKQLQKELEEHNRLLEERVAAQVKQITAAQLSAIFAMCKLAESRDLETGAHLERVRETCRLIAAKCLAHPKYAPLLTPGFVDNMVTATPLHDIGKVGVSDLILQKPGRLTPEEFNVMKLHTTIGASLLREVDRQHPGNAFIAMGMDIAQSHHEKWNGSGYPNGISGDAIPLSARIVAIADVYDALTHARCYKPAIPLDESLKIIKEGSGKHFDPELLDIFVHSIDEVNRIAAELDSIQQDHFAAS